MFNLFAAFKPTLQWILENFPSVIKRPERATDHSPPSDAQVSLYVVKLI
jgi:hypothetical protein